MKVTAKKVDGILIDELIDDKKRPVVVNEGIGTLSLLGIAFVVLKLTNCINWSWWWVLAPFWIPIAVVLVFSLFMFILINVIDKSEEEDATPTEEESEVKADDAPKKASNSKRKATKNGGNTKRKNAEVSK